MTREKRVKPGQLAYVVSENFSGEGQQVVGVVSSIPQGIKMAEENNQKWDGDWEYDPNEEGAQRYESTNGMYSYVIKRYVIDLKGTELK